MIRCIGLIRAENHVAAVCSDHSHELFQPAIIAPIDISVGLPEVGNRLPALGLTIRSKSWWT